MAGLAQDFWDRAWRLRPLATEIPTGDAATDWKKLDGWDREGQLTFHRLQLDYGSQEDGSRRLRASFDNVPIYMGHRYAPIEGDEDEDYDNHDDTILKPGTFIIALDHLRKNMVLDDIAGA